MTYSDSCISPKSCDTSNDREWKSEEEEPNTPANKVSEVAIQANLGPESQASTPPNVDLTTRVEKFDDPDNSKGSLEVNFDNESVGLGSIPSSSENDSPEITPARTRWKTVSQEIQKGLELIHFISMDKTTEAKEFLDSVSNLNVLNQYNESPILCASHRGNHEMIEALAEKGANLDLQDTHGNTGLVIATKFGHQNSVSCLLKNHADVNLPDSEGSTPLMWAFKPDAFMNFESKSNPSSPHPRKEIVRQLLENHADLNAVDTHHMTALAYALCSQNLEANLDLILLLVEGGAKLIIEDYDDLNRMQGYWHLGATALLDASRIGHEKLVKVLISKNVFLEEENLSGETALDLALANGNYEIAKLLREAQKSHSKQEMGTQTVVKVSDAIVQAKSQSKWKCVRNVLFRACSDSSAEVVPHNEVPPQPQS